MLHNSGFTPWTSKFRPTPNSKIRSKSSTTFIPKQLLVRLTKNYRYINRLKHIKILSKRLPLVVSIFRSWWILDTGSARSRLQSTGKVLKGYIIFIMDYFNGTLTSYIQWSYHLWTLITSWSWSYTLLQLDITSTEHYYKTILINGTHTLYLFQSILQDNFFVRCRHHHTSVCIYFGKRSCSNLHN